MTVVKSALNNTIISRLGSRYPLPAFNGSPQDSPLISSVREDGNKVKMRKVKGIRDTKRENVSKVLVSLNMIHKEVAYHLEKRLKQAVHLRSRKHVSPNNFSTADILLRGCLQRGTKRKNSIKWKGPFRVIECRNDYIFVNENFLNGTREEVHGRRLKFFRNSFLEVTEYVLEHLSYQEGEVFVVDMFDDILKKNGVI